MRAVAVDWSGARAASTQRRTIWTAEAEDGRLRSLSAGRLRSEAVDDLRRRLEGGAAVAGLDFAFGFPGWWARRFGDAAAVWDAAARHGEDWLATCEAPFWGRPGRPRPSGYELWRRTEHVVGAAGPRPKSVFQIGGAGAVGTGSLRGMPWLRDLRAAGIAVWPFDAVGDGPFVAEVWPRACTGPVVKSRPEARVAHLRAAWPDDRHADLIEASEDAFDAACTALTLSLGFILPPDLDELDRLEGRILTPGR